VIGRARVAGVTAWQGSFAWNGPRPVGGGELDVLNKGFGQAQVLSSTPITEIEGIYAADILLTGVAETYTGANVALAANMLPYNKSQPAGQSRLYYRSTIGAAIGTRDTLLGWFADQSWQPQISSPDPASPGDVPFYSPTARGDGLAMLFSAAYQDVDSFPQGPPRMSAVVKGVAVFDPRDPDHDCRGSGHLGLYPEPGAAGRLVRHPALFLRRPYSEIDLDALIAAANACDEEVATFSSTGSTTEPRFYCGGEITEEDNRDSTLAAICASMAGSWCIVGGMWFFYAGVYSEPTLAIDDTWIMRG
jgi:hypothetical protein